MVAPRLVAGDELSAPGDPADPLPVEVASASGRAMLVPRVVYTVTAGFDEDYFSSWADVDWCRRIRAAGYTVWSVPTATAVYHRRRPTDRSDRRAVVRDFHGGAYRYWLQHDAPPSWHPWRWIKAVLLATRAGLATMSAEDLS